MRRVAYKSVLAQVASLWAAQPNPSASNGLSATDAALANVFINRRLRKYWEDYPWPQLMVIEKRRFRAAWAVGTAYTAGTEVFYVPAKKYYQALRSSTGQAPATQSGTDWLENSAYWAECATSYTADDWLTGTAYTAGDQVRNPADDTFYQCHTAHTAGATFDSTKFGALTDFIKSVDWDQTSVELGDVFGCYELDPRSQPSTLAWPITYSIVGDDLIVNAPVTEVWIRYRSPQPSYTGNAYASGTTYAAGDQVYDATTGDYYVSLVGSNIGQAVTNTAYWERIDFPEFLQDPVAIGAFADLLKHYGALDKFGMFDREAEREFSSAVRLFAIQQTQNQRLFVSLPRNP